MLLLLLAASPFTFPFVAGDPALLFSESTPAGSTTVQVKSPTESPALSASSSHTGAAPLRLHAHRHPVRGFDTVDARPPLLIVLRI